MICAALIAGMLAAGAWALVHVGGPIATHFDVRGRPDGWAAPAHAFFTLPAIAVAVWALLAVCSALNRLLVLMGPAERARCMAAIGGSPGGGPPGGGPADRGAVMGGVVRGTAGPGDPLHAL